VSPLNSELGTQRQSAVTISSAAVSNAPVIIGVACIVVIVALVLGVGLASNLVLRHLVQTLPIWAGVVFGFRRSRISGWIALPSFIFWLLLMAVIWCYLLGLSHWISGHFSGVEIAMTIIVGIASVIGIVSFVRFRSSLLPLPAAGLFIGMAAFQFACFRISFLPAIAHR
jgi:hypothetical protein